jgi:hypothetical protein
MAESDMLKIALIVGSTRPDRFCESAISIATGHGIATLPVVGEPSARHELGIPRTPRLPCFSPLHTTPARLVFVLGECPGTTLLTLRRVFQTHGGYSNA